MSVVLYEKKGKIAYVTLNRPEALNALSPEVFEGLSEAWNEFNDDPDAWVAVLSGNGRAFCAGADLKRMDSAGGIGNAYRRERRLLPSLGSGLDIWKPIIAAIHGYAVAGGWMLAQWCDLRIASDDAQFGISEVRWNLPAGWVCDLTREISMTHAMEIVLTAQRITAQRAYEIGFVNKVVPSDELMPTASALAELICENGPLSVRAHKEILTRGYLMSQRDGQALGNHVLRHVINSEDAKEGPRAFVEKRKPQFQGR